MTIDVEELDENKVSTEQEQDEDFDAAWDEDESSTTDTDDSLDDELDSEPAQSEEDPEEEADENEDDDKGEQVDEDLKEETDPEKIKQELKTWQGRNEKAKAEALQIEQDLNEKREQLEKLQALQERRDEEGDDSELSAEDQQLLDDVLEDYPSIAKAMQVMAKQTARKESRATTDAVKETSDSVRNLQMETHFNTIREKHADFDQINQSGEVAEWVENQPHKDAVKYQQVMKQGNATQIIELLDTYKKSTNPEGNEDLGLDKEIDLKPESKRDKQLKAGQATRRRSSGAPKAKIAKDDFDGAWDSIPD